MSLQKINIINYCEAWITICSNFGDIEDQRRVWFRGDGPEVGCFSEDSEHLDFILRMWPEEKRNKYLSKKCNDLIQEFLAKLCKFREDPQSAVILEYEEMLLTDPRWLAIAKSAQEAKIALENYIGELQNDDKRR